MRDSGVRCRGNRSRDLARGAIPIDASDRNFNDQEVALILRRAVEMQEAAGDAGPARGLSMEVIREIAAEIGVDPSYVDRAAAALPSDASASRLAALAGGPLRQHMVRSWERELTEAERLELVERIRAATRKQGKVSEVLGSVEWSAGTEPDTLAVTIAPREGGTSIQVLADQSVTAGMTYFLPTFFGTLIGLVIAHESGLAGAATIGSMGVGALGGLGVARTIWTIASRSARARFQRLHAEIDRFMRSGEAPALPSSHDPETSASGPDDDSDASSTAFPTSDDSTGSA